MNVLDAIKREVDSTMERRSEVDGLPYRWSLTTRSGNEPRESGAELRGSFFEVLSEEPVNEQAVIRRLDAGTGVLPVLTVWVPYEAVFDDAVGAVIIARRSSDLIQGPERYHDLARDACVHIQRQIDARREVLAQAKAAG